MARRTKARYAKTRPSRPLTTKAKKRAKTPARKPRRPIKRKLIWQPTPEAQKVIDNCQDVFDNTPGANSDCNKFVKSVCDKFNTNSFSEFDDADAVTDDIRSSDWCARNGWTQLNKDPKKAKDSADRGELVVAGATGGDLNQTH